MLKTIPYASALGATIQGVDLSKPLSEADFDYVHQALMRFGVLLFEDQMLTPHQQVRFARRFGDIQMHPHLAGLPEQPEIMELLKEPKDTMNFGEGWHSDQMYLERPSMGTCLYAKELPPVGGDTLFACMRSAFDALSPGMQRFARSISGIQQSMAAQARDHGQQATQHYASMRIREASEDERPVSHPLARVHPVTREEVLYMGIHTVGLLDFAPDESKSILDFLFEHLTQDRFCCRLRWRPGMVALWDNRRVLHNAMNDYHGHRRLMHRVSIAGDAPVSSLGPT